jgi:hypothetical protein
VTATASILERPVYGVVEAAGLLGLRPDRTRAWLDGYERTGVLYDPVVREKHTGDEIVTWGEFVELSYLREYRRSGVPLQRLRPVIEELRREFGTPYPLATARPFVIDKELVLEIQERNDLPSTIAIVVRSGQQIMLADGANRFFRKVEFDPRGRDAARVRPLARVSPVVIDPLVQFGRPAGRFGGGDRTALGVVRRGRVGRGDRCRVRAQRGGRQRGDCLRGAVPLTRRVADGRWVLR